MAKSQEHLIGLLLGAEGDWPRAFETLARRLGVLTGPDGTSTTGLTERVTIEPFNLRDKPRHDLVIDRLALLVLPPARVAQEGRADGRRLPAQQPVHVPVDGEALGLLRVAAPRMHVPETVLVPYKNPVDNVRWAYTSEQVQQVLRPRRDRRRARLPDVHEAVRRRRLARRLADQGPGRPARGLRRLGRDAHAPAAVGRRASRCSPGR